MQMLDHIHNNLQEKSIKHLLDEWARKLHNCIFSYTNAIKDRRTVIYGVFVRHTLKYAVEIKGNRIVQTLGVSNSGIGAEDREVIDRWFLDVYLRGWIEPFLLK
ncbi:MAG TPA: hypothetical protein ENK98_00910 [Epsilonproteobacteria bacterium]|nr:hypothetical protein [Campylobacterota bacterium]